MSKKYLFILLTVSSSVLLRAQNLVLNPSFEFYNTCPSTLSGIAYSPGYTFFPTVQNWTNPLQNTSPDYFNQCALVSSNASVPNNLFGSKPAHTGNAYAGLIAWEGQYNGNTLINDYREYMETYLAQPMTAGLKYCVTFYVSSSFGQSFNGNYVSIDEIGANFSNSQVTLSSGNSLNVGYSIKNPTGNFISDTSKWYKIKGTYLASGGEQWMTIGCFNPGNIPAYQQLYPQVPVAGNKRIYLFIDDVSVIPTTPADTIYSTRDTSFCAYNNLNCTCSGVPNGDEYLWSTGSNTPLATFQDTGVYWCRTLRDCNVFFDTFHINYRPVTPLDFGNDSVNCHNQPIVLQTTASFQTYSWSTGASSPSITVSQSGTYSLTVTDACGSQQKSINVIIRQPTPPPVVSDTSVCQGAKDIKLNAAGSNLIWYNYLSDIHGFTVQPDIFTNQPGTRILYVSQTISPCESDRVPLKVTVRYQPKADIGDYYRLCVRDTIKIGKEYPDVSYIWSSGQNVCCIHPDHTGNYSFSIYNECGSSTDSVYVDVEECNECLMIPNVFSPNNDGKNDVYKMIAICPVNHYLLRIYNRWGTEVFSSTNPDEGWTGLVNNAPPEPGVYVYVLDYETVDTGMHFFKKGNLTVIR